MNWDNPILEAVWNIFMVTGLLLFSTIFVVGAIALALLGQYLLSLF